MDVTFITDNFLLIGSFLLVISCLFSGASLKFGVPSLIFFLAIGMLAGEDGLGIQFSNPKAAQNVGIVALSFILFSGGLDTKWKLFRPVLWQGVTLASLGVVLTMALLGIAVFFFFPQFGIFGALLVGAVISSTDAAAVFSILRSNNVNLRSRLQTTLELESAANDPTSYLLTVTLIGFLNGDVTTGWGIVFMLIKQIALGAGMGWLTGKFMNLIINKVKLATEGIYPVLLMGLNLMCYAATDIIGGNGFLAVYLAGLVLGNSSFLHKKSLLSFYDGQANLWQIIIFLTLGLLVTPHELIPIAGKGILLAVVLMFFARPIAVFICTLFFKSISFKEKILVSWVGIRGASSIVFATFPFVLLRPESGLGTPEIRMIFHIVFFLCLCSVLLQGTTITKVAKFLYLIVKQKPNASLSFVEIDGRPSSEMMRLTITEKSPAIGHSIVDLNLPNSVLITIIMRDGKYIIPNGSTVVEANDEMMVVALNLLGIEKAQQTLIGHIEEE